MARVWGRFTITAVGLLVIWQVIVWLTHLPPYLLPSPLAVGKQLVQSWHFIVMQSIPTIIEALLGFVLGVGIGSLSALNLVYCQMCRRFFMPILLISQALPTFAIAPLFVIWFGYGEASKIATCILMLFFPVASAFYDGLRRTPEGYMEMASVMQAKPWFQLWRIRVPAALPAWASGVRVAATFAPMGAIIGEWVGSSEGLGYLMLNANARMQIDLMFAVISIVVVLTLLFYGVVDGILRRWINWKSE